MSRSFPVAELTNTANRGQLVQFERSGVQRTVTLGDVTHDGETTILTSKVSGVRFWLPGTLACILVPKDTSNDPF